MKHPPYHLRTNKAVDRLLLVDIVRALKSTSNYSEFTYYTLAGPFLEDLRVMDHYFPQMRLVSLESNAQTYRRQRFHQFTSRIVLLLQSMTDFLARTYVPGEKDMFWLDYTDLKYPHLVDFQVVLKNAPLGSLVRITLRAEPELDLDPLKGRVSDEELKRVKEQLEEAFKDEFLRVLPHEGVDAFASLRDYARMVQLMVRRAASTALDTSGSKRDFLPIQSTRYNDHTQMLSVTGIICNRTEIAATRINLGSVHFANFDWEEPTEVNIPALSTKEQLHLEAYLPVPDGIDAGEWLFPLLGYRIHDTTKSSKLQLSYYADHHREYPNFVRVAT